MLTTIGLAFAGLAARGAAPRPSVAGTYADAVARGRSGAGCTLRVREAAGGTRIRFHLECNRGAPSYNMGLAEGTVPLAGGLAVYRTAEDGGHCELRFAFAGAAARVAQTGTAGACGFGYGVHADGVYRRLSRARPRFAAPR